MAKLPLKGKRKLKAIVERVKGAERPDPDVPLRDLNKERATT